MIKLRFLDNNNFLIRYNGNGDDIFNYLAIISNKLLPYAKPNIAEDGGWTLHYNNLDKIQSSFDNIVYENNYVEPEYMKMGSSMKLKPYEYQKQAIYYTINNLESLLVLPCGSGN